MRNPFAALSFILILALTLFAPSEAAADPLPAGKNLEMSLGVLPQGVSRQDALKLLALGKRLDTPTRAALGISRDTSPGTASPTSPPRLKEKPKAKAMAIPAKASAKLSPKDCAGSGEAFSNRGLYRSRWSWCQVHTVFAYGHLPDGTVVATAFFDTTVIGEGIKGSRTAKAWQYITNVQLYGPWPPGEPMLRFTMPCSGSPSAATCRVEGGQTMPLTAGMERLVSYKFTSSTAGTKAPDKVATAVFKAKYVILESGDIWYGPEQGFRCDSASYLGKRGACLFNRLRGTFKLSRSDKAVDQSAKHIYDALQGSSGIPSSLTRMTNKTAIKANRDKARATCKRKWPRKPAGKDCDEYPFAATNQGAAKANGRFSVRYVTSSDNREAGRRLGAWYKTDRILNGERFDVKIT